MRVLLATAFFVVSTMAASAFHDDDPYYDVKFRPAEAAFRQKMTNECSLTDKLRPVLDVSETVDVYAALNALSFRAINDREQTFTIVAELDFYWRHPCTNWENNEQYKNISYFNHKLSDSWYPTLTHLNAIQDVALGESLENKGYLFFYSNGDVMMALASSYSSFCNLNLKRFPFDSQNCSVILESFVDTRKVRLDLRPDPITIDLHTFMMWADVWSIQAVDASTIDMQYASYPNKKYGRVYFQFTFVREPLIYVVNVILPCFCLVLLLLFSGIMPPRAPERACFCVTVVLANAVLQSTISDTMPPKSSEIAYILVFLLFNSLIGVVISVYNLLTCHLARTKEFQREITCCRLRVTLKVIRWLDVAFYSFAAMTIVIFDITLFSLMNNEQ